MTWKDLWEGIASLFENVLFLPYDALRKLQLDSWWAANFISWIFLLVGAAAFIYWLIQLKDSHYSTKSNYSYDETV